MTNTKLTETQNLAQIATDTYRGCVENTEIFGPSIGLPLAYLLGSILTNEKVGIPEQGKLYKLLKQVFPETHGVWNHVVIQDNKTLRDVKRLNAT